MQRYTVIYYRLVMRVYFNAFPFYYCIIVLFIFTYIYIYIYIYIFLKCFHNITFYSKDNLLFLSFFSLSALFFVLVFKGGGLNIFIIYLCTLITSNQTCITHLRIWVTFSLYILTYILNQLSCRLWTLNLGL